ncbi:MAG: glycosyl hydrolase family 28 protein [Bacteroidia bacterium]
MKKIILIAFVLSAHSTFAREFNIIDFGAVPHTVCTSAIQKAVDVCHEAGGGTVVVPAGIFITGTIILKSNINLYLEQGAELRSSTEMADFAAFSGRYGIIFCQDAHNVSITGEGMIHAMGTQFYETDQNHVYPEFDRQLTRQKEKYMPEGEFYTDGPLKRKPRPGMTLVFFHCTQVRIKGITIKDTPVWAVRFGYCEDVVVEGVSVQNNMMIPNSDGIHCTASRNVRISNCDIRAGDDAIIVTGFAKAEHTPGFNSAEQDAYTFGNKSIYAENIQVTNCYLQSRSAGIRIGYGQHPIRRCIFTNIVIAESNRGIGIFAHDSSSIEELIFSDIIIDTRLHNGQWWGNGEPIHLSAVTRFKGEPAGIIKDIQFNNITATSEAGILLYTLPENPMENIRFQNVQVRIKAGKETMAYGGNFDLRPTALTELQLFEHDIPGLYAQNVNGLSIRDFKLTWGENLPAFFTHGISCLQVKDLYIVDFEGNPNPGSPGSKKLKLEKTTVRK